MRSCCQPPSGERHLRPVDVKADAVVLYNQVGVELLWAFIGS